MHVARHAECNDTNGPFGPYTQLPCKGPGQNFLKKILEETSHEKLHTKSFNDYSYFIRIGWTVLWPQHAGENSFFWQHANSRPTRWGAYALLSSRHTKLHCVDENSTKVTNYKKSLVFPLNEGVHCSLL
jgi:hypothetical protein